MNSISILIEKKSTFAGLVRIMRPKQWIKNGFVLAPLIFAGKFTDLISISDSLLAMLIFCIASSAAYIFNDYHDIELDKKHPVKSQTRPLASGQVSKIEALILLGILYGILICFFFQQPRVSIVISAYLLLNLAYTIILKHQPVIDIFTVAIGFVLRVYAGAMALSVPISSWMFVTTLCLALYLAAVKRHQELAQNGNVGRKVLGHYSLPLVDRYAEIAATGALLFYSLFVMTTRTDLVITIPLVIYGLFRYWFIVEAFNGGESPTEAIFSDWQLLLTVIIWVGVCVGVLWPTGA